MSSIPSPQSLYVATLKGRLQLIRSFKMTDGTRYAHLIALPAPDQYSHPELVEVIARTCLGERDTDITVQVRVGGIRNNFTIKDKDTGEVVQIQSANNRLTAFE